MKDLSHFPKTDIRFWQNAVFRQPYTVDGQRRLTKEWYAHRQYGGKRQFFSLGTPNKAAAAAKARDIYLALIASGWESTLARYKGAKEFAQAKQRQQPCTVGDFFFEVLRTASNQRTVEAYAKAFRLIVSQSFGFAASTNKYDYQHGGESQLLEESHSLQLGQGTSSRGPGL